MVAVEMPKANHAYQVELPFASVFAANMLKNNLNIITTIFIAHIYSFNTNWKIKTTKQHNTHNNITMTITKHFTLNATIL